MSDYHHGDLRNALLDAAQSVLNEKGIHGLSLRACATKAGVSHAAPTHHFKSLSGLLTELAIIAFTKFTQSLRDANKLLAEDATQLQRLQAIGEAYVEFAQAEPELFKLMFSSPLPDFCNEKLQLISGQAYQELQHVVDPLCQLQGIENPQEVEQAEILVWSLVHGYAHLLLKRIETKEIDGSNKQLPPIDLLGRLFSNS